MEERRITIKQAMELLGLSRATIYNWIDKEKLRYEETQRGKMILITDDEVEKIREMNFAYTNQENLAHSNSFEENSQNVLDGHVVQSKIDHSELLVSILERMKDLDHRNAEYVEQIKEYAEQAGQVKLLTSNNEFYKEEYFRVKYEMESLQKLNKELEEKNKTLAEKCKTFEKEVEKSAKWMFWK